MNSIIVENKDKWNKFLSDCMENNKTIYPYPELVFNALNKTPLNKIKVVIILQDPYHGCHIHTIKEKKYEIPEAMGIGLSVPLAFLYHHH